MGVDSKLLGLLGEQAVTALCPASAECQAVGFLLTIFWGENIPNHVHILNFWSKLDILQPQENIL